MILGITRLATERDDKLIDFIPLQPDPQSQTLLRSGFMAYEDCICLIPNSWMKMNNSGVSKYQNIVLMKYLDDRLLLLMCLNILLKSKTRITI